MVGSPGMTPDDPSEALDIARDLAANGVPIFLAHPAPEFPKGGSDGGGYQLPPGWQHTRPDPSVLDRWQPGMAVGAVMGYVVDGLDLDPRSGGDVPPALTPHSYGQQATPSGGTHDLIATLGIASKDGVFPGVDLKAGTKGSGHGFLYLAPTVRTDKRTGELATYRWTSPPNLDPLVLIGSDETGKALAEVVRSGRTPQRAGPSYNGPSYAELSEGKQRQARDHLNEKFELWRALMANAANWAEGDRDPKGRGWEALTRDLAWAVASTAVCPWSALDEDDARDLFESIVPQQIADDPKCRGKWYDGILEKAAARPCELPPWSEFSPVVVVDDRIPTQLDDARLAGWVYEVGLKKNLVWAGGMGWLKWSGRRWSPIKDEDAKDLVRRLMIDINVRVTESGADRATLRQFASLLNAGKLGAITNLLKGVASTPASAFNANHHLLNAANGIVDLRTGKLLPHDPSYRLTRITETPYNPEATHPDWDQCLTALEPEVAQWIQVRFGQGATGHPTSDDILPIFQGSGSNGKTTMLSSIMAALGEHMTLVPEKLLRAGVNDHPTELMTLNGARVAYIDETPEAARLNVQRLKAALGQEYMTARSIAKDNVTWKTTHSLVLSTNYVPIIHETDHGTWRRLALVKFDQTFPKNERFRARLAEGAEGRREAVLAWVVEGARRWYANGKVIPDAPAKVEADTAEWRGESDLVYQFIDERLAFDPNSYILASELLDEMNEWLAERKQAVWSHNLMASRLRDHGMFQTNGVSKSIVRPGPDLSTRYAHDRPQGTTARVWKGIRWATEGEDLL